RSRTSAWPRSTPRTTSSTSQAPCRAARTASWSCASPKTGSGENDADYDRRQGLEQQEGRLRRAVRRDLRVSVQGAPDPRGGAQLPRLAPPGNAQGQEPLGSQ